MCETLWVISKPIHVCSQKCWDLSGRNEVDAGGQGLCAGCGVAMEADAGSAQLKTGSDYGGAVSLVPPLSFPAALLLSEKRMEAHFPLG